jgi:hypothetical protein
MKIKGFVLVVLCLGLMPLGAQTTYWYASNEAGQMLTPVTLSRDALRGKYALSQAEVRPAAIPEELKRYFVFYTEPPLPSAAPESPEAVPAASTETVPPEVSPETIPVEKPWKAECRTLYENTAVSRIQWVFFDGAGNIRFATSKDKTGIGFIERYNEKGFITWESRFDESGEQYEISYRYKDQFLISAESADWKDSYRYTRQGGLRAIDRVFKKKEPVPVVIAPAKDDITDGTTGEAADSTTDGAAGAIAIAVAKPNIFSPPKSFPSKPAVAPAEEAAVTSAKSTRNSIPRSLPTAEQAELFIIPPSIIRTTYLDDALNSRGGKITYKLDDRSRILSETTFDDEGEVTSLLTNTWKDKRIVSVDWKKDGDARRVDFTFNKAGDQTGEKDYRGDVLEREIAINGDRETETLYRNGEPVLIALWENGRKISEDNVTSRRRKKIL